jgi:riboflavin kinase/FMN adenylyltransferase
MIITGLHACVPNGATVVTLGTFDGVHRGHQALFERVKASAQAQGLKSLVLTFPQPPQNHFNGKPSKPLILPLKKKLELIESCGMDTVVLMEFDEVALMSAEAFARQVLKDRLHATEVVVGSDCRFGNGRAGNAETLNALGESFGFSVQIVEPVVVDGVIVSSTEVRRAIEEGEVERAARLLGYTPLLCGHVMMEAPAHLRVDERLAAPKEGLFLLDVKLQGREQPAVMRVHQRSSLNPHDGRFRIHWLNPELEVVPHMQLEIKLLKSLQGVNVFGRRASSVALDMPQDLQQPEWARPRCCGRAREADGRRQ